MELKPSTSKIFLQYWLLCLLYAGLLFYGSTMRLSLPTYHKSQDKFLHLAAYAGLGLLILRGFAHSQKRIQGIKAVVLSIFVASLYGFFIEICQRYCNRSFEIGDIFANILGSSVGALAYHFLLLCHEKMRE